MQTLNQAYEDVAAFKEFQDRLTAMRVEPPLKPCSMQVLKIASVKRPGENRQQYRARLRAEKKAFNKATA